MSRLKAALMALLIVFPVFSAPQAGSFTDVAEDAWFYADVAAMSAEGWLAGYPDGSFRPTRQISRAEFISLTARRAGLPAVSAQTEHWAAGRLQAALEQGWYDWDECPPTGETYGEPISRQVAVKVLMKAFFPEARGDYGTESAKMTDFDRLSGRYYEPVFAAYAIGLVFGDAKGSFRPDDGLSRAEACALIRRAGALWSGQGGSGETTAPPVTPSPASAVRGGVSENGKLRVENGRLLNEQGQPVVLHGMSSHGLQWYGQYASDGAMKTLAEYGANLFRAAMYTGENGYLSRPEAMKKQLVSAVDAAIRNDLYVIIDWHILSDGDPMAHLNEAKDFFREMAQRYGDSPAVLYEICNEPNGNVTWAGNVKPYAQAVVKTIREAGGDGVILIGSPTWSQDIHLAAADPVEGENLMYTLHFYAGTHGKELRERIGQAMARGVGVFVSEWGMSSADGSGGVFPDEAREWLDYLNEKGVSWANWSLCDKNETSAALKPGASPGGGWREAELSESGKFVFGRF